MRISEVRALQKGQDNGRGPELGATAQDLRLPLECKREYVAIDCRTIPVSFARLKSMSETTSGVIYESMRDRFSQCNFRVWIVAGAE